MDPRYTSVKKNNKTTNTTMIAGEADRSERERERTVKVEPKAPGAQTQAKQGSKWPPCPAHAHWNVGPDHQAARL